MTSIFGTDLTPSRICLGTGSFGSEISRADSFTVLDAFVEAGGNFIDTAHIYAAWIKGGWGASERTLGEWLKVHGARGAVVLATKGAHPPLDNMKLARCSKADIEQDVEQSLERLGVDSVDLYWLHRDDPPRRIGEIVETMAALINDGRIRSYGVSNWTVDRIEAALAYAKQHSLPPLVAHQPGWALADRETNVTAPSPMRYLDEPMRQWHIRTSLPLVAYSSQATGFFGAENVAWAKAGFSGPPPKARGHDSPNNRQRLTRAIALAESKGCTPNQIALAYLLNHPFPVFPIIGTSKPSHVREAFAAVPIPLTQTELDLLRA